MSRRIELKNWRAAGAIMLAGSMLCCAGVNLQAADEIIIKADEVKTQISPKFYGIFFEEINMAGDGGLYAELIRNRNFEDSNTLEHWQFRPTGAAKASASLSLDVPTGGFNKHSALLQVDLPQDAQGGAVLANNGYFGISVEKGQSYDLSFYVKGSIEKLAIWLEDENGTTLARSSVKVSKGWNEQKLVFRSKATSHNARLCLGVEEAGELNIDMVSLFPQKTWKGRKNGMREDLGEKLNALRPAFVRFPGGCWVEGDRMATSYRWKETIGDMSQRRTQQNLWGYQVTHGMGYHEYLELCEDLGAQALFVINCGMSHKEVVPMDKMGEYVQDALDAIEYANGDVTTRWGAERARNGHPKPFNLTMLQVGNENGGVAYNERYALFYDAIKAKYPEIKLVACLWGGTPKSRAIEILDEHYYNTPEFFVQRFHQYDTYDRNGPEIYVGEYAVTQQNGQGALRGALGEAVFMMGMENNADVVTMTSYAPLFINVNKRSWNPDLINFDNHRSFGTPSYHVQKMFAQNLGTEVVPVEMKVQPLLKDKSVAGGVGLGTWITQAEFKDVSIKVDGKVLSADQLGDWKTHGGDWKNEDGVLKQLSLDEDVFRFFPAAFKNYTFNVKARKTGGDEGFLILINVQDGRNYVWWNIGGWGNSSHGLEMTAGGAKSQLGQKLDGKIETGKWYDIQVDVLPGKLVCSLDGKVIHEESLIVETQAVYASATKDDSELYVKTVNLSNEPRTVVFKLETQSNLAPKATVLSMSHSDEWAENNLFENKRVVPIEKTISTSPRTECILPPNSVNVFKFPYKK